MNSFDTTTCAEDLNNYILTVPKVELHVHLEGTLDAPTLFELAHANRVQLPAQTVDELKQLFSYTDFDGFISLFRLAKRCIRSADDLELIARRFFVTQAQQNIVYSEVTVTAYSHYLENNLSFDAQLRALNRARAWANTELSISAGWIIDIPRRFDVSIGHLVTEWAIGGMKDGVVGLGLGGVENGNPASRFAPCFARAEAAGLPRTLHAGETVGAHSIREALAAGRANRIGHGIRCLEDDTLVSELRANQIPLEVCPSSNVCLLPEIGRLEHHPLPQLLDAGLVITINSDDPPFFSTTLVEELRQIASTFSLSSLQITMLLVNAARHAFLPQPERLKLESAIFAVAQPFLDGITDPNTLYT